MTTFSLRSVKIRSGEEHRTAQEIDLEPLLLGGQRYIPVPGTVEAELAISRASTGTVLELGFTSRLHGPCYRCLNETVVEERVQAREYQATSPGAADELRSPYLEDGKLDLSSWARDAIVLALPEKILCKPDCAGLCAVCGKDLNREWHTHDETEPDPRWAALSELKDRL